MPSTIQVDQRDTHRLIPTQFAEAKSVLTRLTDDAKVLREIIELDNATDDRLWVESGLAPGLDARELVFGIPSYRIINAAFCHPGPSGLRFNTADRGAWYAAFELATSQAEVAHHRRLWIEETHWEEEDSASYTDYLADFRAEFHDIRGHEDYKPCLSPNSYIASQALGQQLLRSGSSGIVYPSVRRHGGTCLACFRPVLVTNVRQGRSYTLVLSKPGATRKIHWR